MTGSLSSLAIAAFAALALGGTTAYAQSQVPSNCAAEAWSTDKNMKVTASCPDGTQARQPGNAPATANCGVETWSTDKMAYVSTPCTGGVTYENPSGKTSENFNSR
jgi:hypothetical protein